MNLFSGMSQNIPLPSHTEIKLENVKLKADIEMHANYIHVSSIY